MPIQVRLCRVADTARDNTGRRDTYNHTCQLQEPAMSKKLTILIEDSVYECLHRVVGRGTMAMQSYTAIVEKEGDVYVALCPELDVASQGASIEQATANL